MDNEKTRGHLAAQVVKQFGQAVSDGAKRPSASKLRITISPSMRARTLLGKGWMSTHLWCELAQRHAGSKLDLAQ